NVVSPTDLNFLAVLQYAIEVLEVEHVIVCGHYGCGGVRAVLKEQRLGIVDLWLRHVQDVARIHRARLDAIEDFEKRLDRLCELNVIEQVRSVTQCTVVQDAWQRGRPLVIHGWIYGVENGLLCDLAISVRESKAMEGRYAAAIANSCES